MNTTDRHIIHLLIDSGHVDIPEVGSVNLHRIPAHFDGKAIKSPQLNVCFDSDTRLCESTQLIASIGRELKVDSMEAEDILVSDIESFRSDISAGEKYRLGNLGYFVDNGSGLEFFSSAKNNLSFNYPSIELSPIVKDKRKQGPLPIYAQTEQKREEFLNSLRRAASSAAAVAIVAVLAYVIALLPSRNNSANQASLIIDQPSHPSVEVMNHSNSVNEPALVLVFNTPADASCEVDDIEAAISEGQNRDSQNNTEGSIVSPTDQDWKAPYCLVVASLASEDDAYKFIESTDTSLSLLCIDGKFRVYAMEGDSFESLYNAASEAGLFESYPNAWICKR